MGHLEDAALAVATEHSVGTWALIIRDLKNYADSLEEMKDKFPEDSLGLKVDVIVRLLGDLTVNAEEKRIEASKSVTNYYRKHQQDIEKAIKEEIIEQERLAMFDAKMKPYDGTSNGGYHLFQELHDEDERHHTIFG